MPALLEALRAGLFRRDRILPNVVAGVIVGVVALPLAMAFAIASGAKPEAGLYTALVAGFVVTVLGGSRVQIAGPTGAFVVLLAGITARYGLPGLQVVTVLAGLMLLAFGLLRMGSVIRFIPESVILGFTAGIAVVIFVGQWESFFGLPHVPGDHFHEMLLGLIAALPHLDPATTAVGVACLVLLIAWPRIPVAGKVPAPLIALVAATAAQTAFHFPGVATLGSAFGGLPLGLPAFHVPAFSTNLVLELLQPAFAVALLVSIESLLSATVADGMTGVRHDSNQELIGQGLANIAAAFFGGFAATGAIARTATNVRHGGSSPLAGLVHALTVALVLVLLAPLAYNVPLAALAAILFVVAFNMSNAAHLLHTARRAPRTDVAVMVITLLLTVFADLVVAVEVGVILAMLNFMRRMAAAVEVRPVAEGEMSSHLEDGETVEVPDGTIVYSVEGPFFFGAVDQFEEALLHTGTDPDSLVISLARVPFIDLTGLEALDEVVGKLRRRGVRVAACCANASVAEKLDRSGIELDFGLPASSGLADTLAAIEAEGRRPA
jgi:SulP family sulfate permease